MPPQTGSPGDTDAQKRAKHVVLADTIALLKSLQPQLRALNGSASPSLPPLARAPSAAAANANAGLPASGWPQAVAAAADGFKAEGQQAGCGFAEDSEAQQRGSCCSSDSHEQLLLARMAQQQQAAGAAWPPPLPSVPAAIDSEYRVAVEPRPDGAMFVRVKCRDRRGLLCDISNSLKQLPLEVTTAAITTTPDGRVHDVFEIRPMKGVNVSMAEVHACVEMALLEMATMGSVHGTKRLRGALG